MRNVQSRADPDRSRSTNCRALWSSSDLAGTFGCVNGFQIRELIAIDMNWCEIHRKCSYALGALLARPGRPRSISGAFPAHPRRAPGCARHAPDRPRAPRRRFSSLLGSMLEGSESLGQPPGTILAARFPSTLVRLLAIRSISARATKRSAIRALSRSSSCYRVLPSPASSLDAPCSHALVILVAPR